MDNKKQWITPEIKSVDVDQTEGGFTTGASEDGTYHS